MELLSAKSAAFCFAIEPCYVFFHRFSRGQNWEVRLKSIQLREAGDNPARSDCAGWRNPIRYVKQQIESCVASAASLDRKPRIFKARDRIEHAPNRARLDASSCKALRAHCLLQLSCQGKGNYENTTAHTSGRNGSRLRLRTNNATESHEWTGCILPV